MSVPQLEIGPLAPDGGGQVREALDRGRRELGLEQRSSALWDWRASHPGGAYLGVARAGHGAVVSALVGVRHSLLLEGTPVSCVEIVDVYNDFDAGDGLARTRAHRELCKTFASEVGGRAPEAAPVFFGLPIRRAHRLQLATMKSEILRSENMLSMRPSSVTWKAAHVEVEEVDEFPSAIAGAFERFASRRSALLVRDAERLNWRFARHPERSYRIALARRGGELSGYAVLRIGTYAGHEGGVLADWMVEPDDPDTIQELLMWAAKHADASGFDRLVCNVPDMSPEFGALQGVGFRAFGTDEYLTFRSFQKPYTMSWLFANWFYTLGDSERG